MLFTDRELYSIAEKHLGFSSGFSVRGHHAQLGSVQWQLTRLQDLDVVERYLPALRQHLERFPEDTNVQSFPSSHFSSTNAYIQFTLVLSPDSSCRKSLRHYVRVAQCRYDSYQFYPSSAWRKAVASPSRLGQVIPEARVSVP